MFQIYQNSLFLSINSISIRTKNFINNPNQSSEFVFTFYRCFSLYFKLFYSWYIKSNDGSKPNVHYAVRFNVHLNKINIYCFCYGFIKWWDKNGINQTKGYGLEFFTTQIEQREIRWLLISFSGFLFFHLFNSEENI